MGQSIALVDWHRVGDTIPGIKHDPGGPPRGVQGQDSLDGHVHGGRVERLEHDLCHLFSVGFRI